MIRSKCERMECPLLSFMKSQKENSQFQHKSLTGQAEFFDFDNDRMMINVFAFGRGRCSQSKGCNRNFRSGKNNDLKDHPGLFEVYSEKSNGYQCIQ